MPPELGSRVRVVDAELFGAANPRPDLIGKQGIIVRMEPLLCHLPSCNKSHGDVPIILLDTEEEVAGTDCWWEEIKRPESN